MDIDEGTVVFRRRRYKDKEILFAHIKSNQYCGCNANNPYTTLNWSKNSCSCCHKKTDIKTAPNSITHPLDVRPPLVHSPPIDVRSPSSTISSLSNSISSGTFTKYTPKCFIPGGSRFSTMKLDKSFLKKDKCGLAQIWPNNINEVDDYWHCKIVYDRGKLPKLPTQTLKTDPITEFIQGVRYNVEKGNNLPEVSRKFYDINKNKRCRKFMRGAGCSSNCKNLHILPKEDGILCKFYFFYMECYGNDCIYLHSERCSSETKKAYEDKLALGRCSRFLKFGNCFKKDCTMIHRFPKDDGIFCRSQVNACCSYGSKCKYLHRKDLDFSANDENMHLDAAEKTFNDLEVYEESEKVELNMICVPTALNDKPEVDQSAGKNNLSDNESSENHYDNYFSSSDSHGERTSYTGVGDLMSIIGRKGVRNISTPHSDDYLNINNVSSISTYSNKISFSKISREHVNKSGKIRLRDTYNENNQRDFSASKVHTQDEVSVDYSRPKLNQTSEMTEENEMNSILSKKTRKSKSNVSKVIKKNDTQTSHINSLQSSDNTSTNVDCIMESEHPLCREVGGLQGILKEKVNESEIVSNCRKTDSSSKHCEVSTMKNISSNLEKDEYLNPKDNTGDNSVPQNLNKVNEMNSIDEYEARCLDTASSFNKDVNEVLQISDSEASDNDNEYHFNKDPEVERLSYDGVGKLLESLVNIQKIHKHPHLNIPTTTTTGSIKNDHSIANKPYNQGANNASLHTTTVNKTSSILENKNKNENDASIIKHIPSVNVTVKKEPIEDIISVQKRHIFTNSNDSELDMNCLDYDVPNVKIKKEMHDSNNYCSEMNKFQVKNIKNEIIIDDSSNERCNNNGDVFIVLEEIHGSSSNDSDDTVIFNKTKSDTSKIQQTYSLKQTTNMNKIGLNMKCNEPNIARKSQLTQNSLEANKIVNSKINVNNKISMKYNSISTENNAQPSQNSLEANEMSSTKNTVNYKSPTKSMFNDNSKKIISEKVPISKMVDANYKYKNKSTEHESSVNHGNNLLCEKNIKTCSTDKGTSTKQTISSRSLSTICLNTKTSNKLNKIAKGKLKLTKGENINHKGKSPSSKYFHRFSFETANTKENVNHNVENLPWQHLAKKMKKCFVKLVDIISKVGNADVYVQNKIKQIDRKPVPVKTKKTSFEDAINQFSPEISNKKNLEPISKHSLNKSKVANNEKLNQNSLSFKQVPSKLDSHEQVQEGERMVSHKNTHIKIDETYPKKKSSNENFKISLFDTPTKKHLSYLQKEKSKVMSNEEGTKKTQANSLIQSEHKSKCLNKSKISHSDKSKSPSFEPNADIVPKGKNSNKRMDNFQRNISKLTSFNKNNNNVTSESTMEDSLLLHKNKKESLIIDRQVNEDHSCSNRLSSQISSASTGKCHKIDIHKRKLTESASKLSNKKTKLIYNMESDTIKKNTYGKDSWFNSDSSEQTADNLINNSSSPESNSLKRKINSNENLSKKLKIFDNNSIEQRKILNTSSSSNRSYSIADNLINKSSSPESNSLKRKINSNENLSKKLKLLFDNNSNEQRKILNSSSISSNRSYSNVGSPMPGSSSSDEIQYNQAVNKTICPIRRTTINIQDQLSEASSSIPRENRICDFIDDVHINQEIIRPQTQSCSDNVSDKHKTLKVPIKELDSPTNMHDSSQNINQRQLIRSSDNSLSKKVIPNFNVENLKRKVQLIPSHKSTKISNNSFEMASNVTNSLFEKHIDNKYSKNEIKESLKKSALIINRTDKLQSVRANTVITKIKSSVCNSSKESSNISKESNVIDNKSTKMARKSSTTQENKIESDIDDTDFIPPTTNPEEEYILNAAKETLEGFKGRVYKKHNLCNAFITLCEENGLEGVVRDNTVASLDKNIRLFWTSSFTKKYSLDNSCIDRVVNYDLNLKEFAAILKSMEDNFFT